MLFGKKIFATVNPSSNKLWKGHEILFDVIIRIQQWVEKIRALEFSQFCAIFLILHVLHTQSQASYCFKIFVESLFFYIIVILQNSNKRSRRKYLVSTEILVHGNFILERFQHFSWKNKQLSNSKIGRLYVISIIKFVVIIFVILSDYVTHYPIRVNFATF